MNPIVTYYPDKGFSIDGSQFRWGTDREDIRSMLNNIHEAEDIDFDISNYQPAPSELITVGTDKYFKYGEADVYFELNYDQQNRLVDGQFESGFTIKLGEYSFDFTMTVKEITDMLDCISQDKKQLLSGGYFYEDLKLVITSMKYSGGFGNGLAYFYCSRDVNHITE